jgi:hypothetical protein
VLHLWRKPPTRTQICTRCGITRTLKREGPKGGRFWVYTRGSDRVLVTRGQYERQPLCGDV